MPDFKAAAWGSRVYSYPSKEGWWSAEEFEILIDHKLDHVNQLGIKWLYVAIVYACANPIV
jgi:hypothetical protein